MIYLFPYSCTGYTQREIEEREEERMFISMRDEFSHVFVYCVYTRALLKLAPVWDMHVVQ